MFISESNLVYNGADCLTVDCLNAFLRYEVCFYRIPLLIICEQNEMRGRRVNRFLKIIYSYYNIINFSSRYYYLYIKNIVSHIITSGAI